jgi:hypothetical protein
VALPNNPGEDISKLPELLESECGRLEVFSQNPQKCQEMILDAALGDASPLVAQILKLTESGDLSQV